MARNQSSRVAKKLVFDIMDKRKNGEDSSLMNEIKPFSQETVHALQELGNVYRKIHNRLISEGYRLRNGKLIKPGSSDETQNGTKGY